MRNDTFHGHDHLIAAKCVAPDIMQLLVVYGIVHDHIETVLEFSCQCRPETTAGRPETSVWIARVREFQVHYIME